MNNPSCPACIAHRYHSDLERITHHPLSGHGFTKEFGWTHPDAETAHNREQAEITRKQEALNAERTAKEKRNPHAAKT